MVKWSLKLTDWLKRELNKVNTFDNEEYTDNRQQTNVDQNKVLLVLGNNCPNPSGLLISHLPKSRVFLSALIYINPWPNRQSICGMTIVPSSESTHFGTFVTPCQTNQKMRIWQKHYCNIAAPMEKLLKVIGWIHLD